VRTVVATEAAGIIIVSQIVGMNAAVHLHPMSATVSAVCSTPQ
jgi:hypothetical protein